MNCLWQVTMHPQCPLDITQKQRYTNKQTILRVLQLQKWRTPHPAMPSICPHGCSDKLVKNYQESTTSREYRHKMQIPNKLSLDKWRSKLQSETKPRSPTEFHKTRTPTQFTNLEITISSKPPQVHNPKLRKPSAQTVDHEVCDAICSRKPTLP